MTDVFAPDDIDRMSAEIDAQLRELGTPGTGLARGGDAAGALGEKQRTAIETATGEEAMTFLARFRQGGAQGPVRARRYPPHAMEQVAGHHQQGRAEDLQRHPRRHGLSGGPF